MQLAKSSPYLTACFALLSGGVGALAFSPFDYWGIIFVSAFGLIWSATQPSRQFALWTTFGWAVAYFAIGINWVQVSMTQFGGVPIAVSYLAVFLLACYLALYPLLFGVIVHRFQVRNPFILASLFTGAEYLRGVVFTGFPWLQFGYSLIDSPFAGLAPLLGVEGLTFLVMVVSGYLVQIFCQKAPLAKPLIGLVISLGVAITSQFFNFVQIDPSKSPLKISLVQGNIEQKMKWDPAYFNYTLDTYQRLITPLIGNRDLIILPESAIPATEDQVQWFYEPLKQVAQAKGTEVIIGSLYRQNEEMFNSASVLTNPASPRYFKSHLVPFGEYVPFGTLLDKLREVFVLPVNLSSGDFIQPPLIAQNQRFNMAICYEIIFGDQVQHNQQASNADYLLTISNDAWFGSSIGPWQHFQIARMRALELGKPLIRATNTGVTAVIDERGKVMTQIPQFEATVLSTEIRPTLGETPFKRFGNLPIYLLSLCLILIHASFSLLKRDNL